MSWSLPSQFHYGYYDHPFQRIADSQSCEYDAGSFNTFTMNMDSDGIVDLVIMLDPCDDIDIGRTHWNVFKSAGFSVKTYGSAQEFLDDDHIERPELLVVDVRMPGMSGLDLQNHLTVSGHTIPIVFITAHENGMAKTKAMTAGAAAFL